MEKGTLQNSKELKWCFAIINGKLGEIFFNKSTNGQPKIHSHCNIKREEYSKKAQKMIDTDIAKYRFTYQKGKFRRVGEKTLLSTKNLA